LTSVPIDFLNSAFSLERRAVQNVSGETDAGNPPLTYEERLNRLEQNRLEQARLVGEEQRLPAGLAGDTPSWLSLQKEKEAAT